MFFSFRGTDLGPVVKRYMRCGAGEENTPLSESTCTMYTYTDRPKQGKCSKYDSLHYEEIKRLGGNW